MDTSCPRPASAFATVAVERSEPPPRLIDLMVKTILILQKKTFHAKETGEASRPPGSAIKKGLPSRSPGRLFQ